MTQNLRLIIDERCRIIGEATLDENPDGVCVIDNRGERWIGSRALKARARQPGCMMVSMATPPSVAFRRSSPISRRQSRPCPLLAPPTNSTASSKLSPSTPSARLSGAHDLRTRRAQRIRLRRRIHHGGARERPDRRGRNLPA